MLQVSHEKSFIINLLTKRLYFQFCELVHNYQQISTLKNEITSKELRLELGLSGGRGKVMMSLLGQFTLEKEIIISRVFPDK